LYSASTTTKPDARRWSGSRQSWPNAGILTPDGYEEITYAELERRRKADPSYADKRFIPLHGTLMEVSETDYKAFYRCAERQKYLRKEAIRVSEVSYNALDSDEMNGEEIIPDPSPPPEDAVSDKLLLEQMLGCFGQLAEDDRALLTALYFDGKSENEVSRELGITQQAVNKRRQKAIRKLKERMGF
jgi:RNA polymerase sigma factor (sigma-70 family)